MALIDSQPFVARRGHLLLGEVGATEPTQAEIDAFVASNTPITGLIDIGHTNREGFLNDGTEATTEIRGSYQNPNLMIVTTEEATEFVTTDSLQVTDTFALDLFYGNGTAEDGRYLVPPSSGVATEHSLLLIRTNGQGYNVGEWYPKVAVQRNGVIQYVTDDFSLMPLRFTGLQVTGQPFKVIISDNIEDSTP